VTLYSDQKNLLLVIITSASSMNVVNSDKDFIVVGRSNTKVKALKLTCRKVLCFIFPSVINEYRGF
jgi:hypothetical protein